MLHGGSINVMQVFLFLLVVKSPGSICEKPLQNFLMEAFFCKTMFHFQSEIFKSISKNHKAGNIYSASY